MIVPKNKPPKINITNKINRSPNVICFSSCSTTQLDCWLLLQRRHTSFEKFCSCNTAWQRKTKSCKENLHVSKNHKNETQNSIRQKDNYDETYHVVMHTPWTRPEAISASTRHVTTITQNHERLIKHFCTV